jgi:hypothetical protein
MSSLKPSLRGRMTLRERVRAAAAMVDARRRRGGPIRMAATETGAAAN